MNSGPPPVTRRFSSVRGDRQHRSAAWRVLSSVDIAISPRIRRAGRTDAGWRAPPPACGVARSLRAGMEPQKPIITWYGLEMDRLVHQSQKELGAREPPVNFVTRQGILAFGSNARNRSGEWSARRARRRSQTKQVPLHLAERGARQAFTAAWFSRPTDTSPVRPQTTSPPSRRASWPGSAHLGPAERHRIAPWCALSRPRQAAAGREGADPAPARRR